MAGQSGVQLNPGAAWFADARGIDRRLKVSWRPEHRLIVLSVWRGDECTATFRLPVAEASRLLAALGDSVADAVADAVGDGVGEGMGEGIAGAVAPAAGSVTGRRGRRRC